MSGGADELSGTPEDETNGLVEAMPPMPAPVAHAGPPLPATGLPEGWTMEQWAYYGQQYLDRQQ